MSQETLRKSQEALRDVTGNFKRYHRKLSPFKQETSNIYTGNIPVGHRKL
jgi:hypothetical protein